MDKPIKTHEFLKTLREIEIGELVKRIRTEAANITDVNDMISYATALTDCVDDIQGICGDLINKAKKELYK